MNLLVFLLQTTVDSKELAERMDSIRRVSHNFAQTLVTDPDTALKQLGQDAIDFGLKVLAALAIYFIGIWVIGRIKKVLAQMFTRRKTDKTLASFVTSFISFTLTVLLVVMTVSALGVNTTSLAALLAAGGMAIGMALSGTVQNFAGGIMLLAFKPFKVGDFIEAQGFAGTVAEMTIVSTKLTLPDNRYVSLPNGSLSNGTINNYTRNPYRRVEWKISLAYGTDAQACRDLLLKLLKEDKRVLDSTTKGAGDPMTALLSLDDSAIVFVVRGWVKPADYWDVFFDYNQRAYTVLPENGFGFPFPQMDVHIQNQ